MKVERLQLANVRAIQSATFEFQPGFNLIVGVNGVGKTTVLKTLTHALTIAAKGQGYPVNAKAKLAEADVRYGTSGLSVKASLQEPEADLAIIDAVQRNEGLIGRPGEIAPDWDKLPKHIAQRRGKLRQAMREAQDTPSEADLPLYEPKKTAFKKARTETNSALAILFGTDRAFAVSRKVAKGKAAGGVKSAFADALSSRTLNPQLFAEWMRTLEALSKELPQAKNTLRELRTAVATFVPGYTNLRPTTEGPPSLLIDQSEPQRVTVKELSGYDRHRFATAMAYADDQIGNWTPDGKDSPKKAAQAKDAFVKREIESALQRFMSGFEELDRSSSKEDDWTITRLPGTFDVSELSDGERSLISMVLDISRRMIAAYPECKEPTKQGEAIVLIDEIELHLHPRWQRLVVRNLADTFPKCQFIATTHSPQVIGEVQNNHIQIIRDDGVYTPDHSYGMRSGRVLEELMGTAAQTKEIAEKLSQAAEAAANEDYPAAKALIVELGESLGEDNPDLTRIRSLVSFMEGDDE